MENTEQKLRQSPYFCCEKGSNWVPVCHKCEACVLAWKIFATKEWFRRVNDTSQRRFLVSILVQLNSLYLLQYFQNILETTQGKDFIYNRSRIKLNRKGGKEEEVVKSSLNQMLDKTVESKMKEILCWFGNSTHRTKANYTLLLLQMCDSNLLLTAANVIRVLFMKEWNNISGLREDASNVIFFPEKTYNATHDISYISWSARPKPVSFPMSRHLGNKLGTENVDKGTTEAKAKSSLHVISEINKEIFGRGGTSRLGDEPCNLLLSLDHVQLLSSGFSKYRDFIRDLPLHLSKYILRMLDKNSLNKCVFVSQHWATLVQQVKVDQSMHSFIQNQITLLQVLGSERVVLGTSLIFKLLLNLWVSRVDSNFLEHCTEIGNGGGASRLRVKSMAMLTPLSLHQNDYNLWTAYQNQETQLIQMEERNVFCGTYNIRILSDTFDQNRIIHYSGGDLMAVSSNRKIHLLDIMQVRELPIEFRGHAGSIRALFLSEEDNILLSGSYDLSIRYWDIKTGACIRIFYGHQGTITCLDLYKNRLVSGAKDGQVKEWDIETGKCLKTFKHKDPILAARISETYIVSSCERGIVKVWHVVTAQLQKTLTGHEGAVKCLFFNQWHLVSGGADGLVMAWSMVGKYERCLMAFKHPKEVLQVSLLYLRVISACGDGKIRIYNFLNGNCLKVIKVDARGDPVLSFFYQGNRWVVGRCGGQRHESDDVENPGSEASYPLQKSGKVPITPDRFLLTLNALQAHNSEEFAYPHRPRIQVIDAWGLSIPYQRKVLTFKGKSVQHAVDQLRSSNLLTDVKQTNIPLEIRKLQPDLKKSLHSPRVQASIPQPSLIRPKVSDSLRGDEHLTSSIDGRAGPLTSLQVIKPNRMLAPRGGTTTLSLKKERPRFYTTLNPLRMNTGFMLLTVKEEKEFAEAKIKEYEASVSTKEVDPGKASKAAWIRKIKGLPIDHFLKEGKTAAPELGQNVFI
eukprot:XP_017453281.1 PREDICTED: CMT1A duplicated region transcript 1 protein isoform X1 [Rattus norvegicus]